ncbi:MAG: Nif3-like dinuclear metal center hexameric protein [Arcanobacterium sp.]|nr:Nif3-like dinuclear metal center hexameric protein [Arcanobacterium sp.]
MAVTVADIVNVMNQHYPPALAEEWDRVGLSVGVPSAEVHRVGFAVDPCEATVREAIERGAQMLITHHPLFLRGTHSVATTTGKGAWVTDLIRSGCALFSAHTNADSAADGSGAALANLLKLENVRPLEPSSFDQTLGIGTVGELPLTMSVRELAQRIKALIPETPAGITLGGDPERIVRTVALCPGAGDSLFAQVRAAHADVYVTADLRHHPATDHLWNGGCPLIGLSHFASEWPLLVNLRRRVSVELGLSAYISTIVTDPWAERI